MKAQTAIEAPPNRHDYRKGLDETLKAQQLQAILARNPNVKVYPKGKKSGRPAPVPMFEEQAPREAAAYQGTIDWSKLEEVKPAEVVTLPSGLKLEVTEYRVKK